MRGIGYFLGATVGAAILFFVVSYIFLGPRNVNKTQIKRYVSDSKFTLIVEVPLLTSFDIPATDERLGRETKSKVINFSNRNMKYVRADTYTYFSKELNKYVRTYSISETGNMSGVILDFGRKEKDLNKYPNMYFYYNKTQNADPTFGTIGKPLPILHFRSSNPALRSMRSNNKDADPDYLKQVYEENVKLYLEYFIEKEDFKKLFPES